MFETVLKRSEAAFDLEPLRSFYSGKRVLVTGAAGSVGSALSRQLARMGCAQLGVLDQFDHGLLELVDQVRAIAPDLGVTDALCDIRDAQRLEAWVCKFAPDIVIHAAALKHVHLGERHPVECVLTNLVGVKNALQAADRAGASHFMLISTDKAAAPTCVMGATKRLAELHLAAFSAERASPMRARSVRFGNVLGSQGSVLPRFAAQIERGGPLELTHPEMERFFMSESEAVGLILTVTAMDDPGGDQGAYFMGMGEPISILELGRDLIKRSGNSVRIEITGLRPGEKLKEELYDQFEIVEPTAVPQVFRIRSVASDAHFNSADINQLEKLVRETDPAIVGHRIFARLDERLRREELAVG